MTRTMIASTRRKLAAAALVTFALGGVAWAQPQLVSSPDRARFRLLGEDGLASPDGHAYVPAVKLWILADRVSGQCTLLVFAPGGVATTPVQCP